MNKEIIDFLQASVIDANKYPTKEESLKHITSYVTYTPLIKQFIKHLIIYYQLYYVMNIIKMVLFLRL